MGGNSSKDPNQETAKRTIDQLDPVEKELDFELRKKKPLRPAPKKRRTSERLGEIVSPSGQHNTKISTDNSAFNTVSGGTKRRKKRRRSNKYKKKKQTIRRNRKNKNKKK